MHELKIVHTLSSAANFPELYNARLSQSSAFSIRSAPERAAAYHPYRLLQHQIEVGHKAQLETCQQKALQHTTQSTANRNRSWPTVLSTLHEVATAAGIHKQRIEPHYAAEAIRNICFQSTQPPVCSYNAVLCTSHTPKLESYAARLARGVHSSAETANTSDHQMQSEVASSNFPTSSPKPISNPLT
jgi:hypothetical protein